MSLEGRALAVRLVAGLALAAVSVATLAWFLSRSGTRLVPARPGLALLEREREATPPTEDAPGLDLERPGPGEAGLPPGLRGDAALVVLLGPSVSDPVAWSGAPALELTPEATLVPTRPLVAPPPWAVASVRLPSRSLDGLSPDARAALVRALEVWGRSWTGDAAHHLQPLGLEDAGVLALDRLVRWRR